MHCLHIPLMGLDGFDDWATLAWKKQEPNTGVERVDTFHFEGCGAGPNEGRINQA